MDSKRRGSSRVRNDLFDPRKNFDLGRPRSVFMLWYLLKCVFFLSSFPWPSRFKSWLLRLFGAEVGRAVYWKPRVNIHIPWNLKVGDHTWVGEEVCIINFAPSASARIVRFTTQLPLFPEIMTIVRRTCGIVMRRLFWRTVFGLGRVRLSDRV